MSETTNQTPNAEQAADLAALEAAAAQQAPAPGAPGETVQEAPPNLADELSAMIKIAVATLKPALPSLEEIYTPEATGAASAAIAGVCQKHGWLNGGLMGKWGEEIACLAIVGPLAFATYQGVNKDLAAAKAKAEKKKPEALTNQISQAPGPESKTVTFGNQPVAA